MAVFKKSAPAAEPFRVPSLGEVDADYREIEQKISALQADQSATTREISVLEQDIHRRPAPAVRAGVAALIGEVVDTTLEARPARLRELRQHAQDIEAAVEILRRRLADRRASASAAVRAAVKDEYGRRVGAVAEALKEASAAHLELVDLIDQLEREDVSWVALGPMQPRFLGDPRDGHVQRYLKEAKELGYVD
ncbi:hypothetical protein [Sinorhizobium meliloti]|uniref:hypothetical protein n=1 Tax=Rhizobium meliloti TaxID=382 RepID=UPI00067F6676|nr:hypothetical protein [Sinorhizobium meliloti]MQX19792.1 hypothetical protein [Sinorhizobium meliloti]RVG18554.1 hypothetical protein CN231_10340 [Sinorhizobium meliloti]RVP13389.1 hypothetical protein CN085_18515 [Sinorhizobium meliloti]UFX07393.1 hypothetical protein SmelRRI128_13065 [Sinorhizobium meliloti]